MAPGSGGSLRAPRSVDGADEERLEVAVLVLVDDHRHGKLTLLSGAFVAQPSVDNARSVFAARRAIEPAIARTAAERATKAQIAALREHLDAETDAQTGNHRHDAIRLSGAFHVTLAEFGGNPVLTRIVADLVARTSLIIGLFGAADTSCSEGDHRLLIGAISKRDGARASALMETHLAHIEKDLELADVGPAPVDVRSVLALNGHPAVPSHQRR